MQSARCLETFFYYTRPRSVHSFPISWSLHRRFPLASRCLSTAVDLAPSERVDVPVGADGAVRLDLYKPSSPSSAVILHLPRGELEDTQLGRGAGPASLAAASNATVVQLHYRLSRQRRFPLPIHDVLAGYDWIAQNLFPNPKSKSNSSTSSSLAPTLSSNTNPVNDRYVTRRIGVCGELFGASLAAMLGFTECHRRSNAVGAMAISSPVVDWTAMHPVQADIEQTSLRDEKTLVLKKSDRTSKGQKASTSQTTASRTAKRTAGKKRTKIDAWTQFAFSDRLSVSALLAARCHYFRQADDYFDPFASPLLFFRTPGIEVPPEIDALEEMFAHEQGTAPALVKKRQSHRRYPPSDTDLRLPDLRLQVGEENVLKDQGLSLAACVARSNDLYDDRMTSGVDASPTASANANTHRVEIQISEGVGLWTVEQMEELGVWFQQVLDPHEINSEADDVLEVNQASSNSSGIVSAQPSASTVTTAS